MSESTPRTFASRRRHRVLAAEALAHRVERARADVAVDDAERAEREAAQADLVLAGVVRRRRTRLWSHRGGTVTGLAPGRKPAPCSARGARAAPLPRAPRAPGRALAGRLAGRAPARASCSAARASSQAAVSLRFSPSESARERTSVFWRESATTSAFVRKKRSSASEAASSAAAAGAPSSSASAATEARARGLGRGHPRLERGHRGVLGLADVGRLEHLDLAHGEDGRRRERLGAGRALGRRRARDRREARGEVVRRLAARAEREPPGLLVRVAAGELEQRRRRPAATRRTPARSLRRSSASGW